MVDGQLTDAVWASAPSYNLTFGGIPATVRFVHTATTLYVGVSVQDLLPNNTSPSISVYFDSTDDGIKNIGEDAWVSFVGLAGEDFFWNGSSHFHDTVAGGTSDTVATSMSAPGNVQFEISHPLCTTDTAHDICASVPSTLGAEFQYQQSSGPFFDAPGASSVNEADWANLTLASGGGDSTPPSVTWVQPATGGTTLSGIQTLTVNASDDVGVDHVAFDYFDGTNTYVLGTDSTAPYSIQFNTWAFPDRPVGSATVYAQSFDTVGNSSTHTGVSVGINNGQSAGAAGGTVHGSIDIDYVFLVGMPPNAAVNGTVSATPGHAAATWSATTDAGGNAQIPPSGRWDLVPGTVVTADDGVHPKSVTLVPIHISGVNYGANTASGTGPGAGAQIRVTLFNAAGGNLGFDFATTDGSGNWTVSFTGGRQVAAGDYLIADTADADGDRTRADLAVSPDAWAVSIAGTPTSQAGVGSVALTGSNAIPPNLITGVPGGPPGTGLGGIGLGGIGLGGIGLGGIGLGGITLDHIGLGGIGLGGIGLGGIGLGGIGLDQVNLTQDQLGGVPLSTIPLKAPDSWQAHLNRVPAFTNVPPQSVRLSQVIGDPAIVGDVDLKDLDISGSALGGIGLGGIALGGIQLANVGLGGIGLGGIAPTPTQNLQAWCDYINTQPGFHCGGTSELTGKTVMDISLQGIGLGGIPFEQIGLGGIDLSGTGLGGIPIGTALGGIGLGGIGLGGIDLTGTALGGIGLGGIDWAPTGLGGIGLGGIALGGIPNKSAILNCPTGPYTCPDTDTLAQAAAAGAIKPDATVEDIGYYCVAGVSTPQAQWCRSGDKPILMQDFIKNLPPTVTLADLLGSLLPKATYDWEKLPLDSVPLQDYSSDGGLVTYTVTFTVTGADTTGRAADVVVTLPDGARYVKGTTTSDAALSQNDPDLDVSANELTWHATVPPGTQKTLTFKAKPGIELGTENASARIVVGFGEGASVAARSPNPAATSITQTFPGNGAATSPQIIGPDKLYLEYTPNGADRDYLSLPLDAPGTKVTVHLGHLKVDDDLVVFAPTVDPLRVPKPGTAATVAPNVEPTLEHQSQPIKPEVLSDVPQTPPAGQSVVGVSDNRGLADEEVTFIVPEHSPGANATIQVTSYDGGYSNDPWTLRVEQTPAIPLPTTCSSTPLVGGGTTMTMPRTVGGSTLYLFNSKRFGDIYGAAAETSVATKLATLAGRSDAAGGAVIPIDAVSSIATPLSLWYSHACSPGAGNDVVRAIGKYLDTLPATYKYVVIVGGYDVIPPGLVLDDTSYVNEREYASTFYGATNNQYLAAYALGYLPTDDPFGDTNYTGSGAYVPEVPVGRLIETPTQITDQLDKYVSLNGSINPTTALVTGYDFLSDGSTQVANALKPKVPAPATLINNTWTRSGLISGLFPASGGPQIDVVNAHYDHQRALPAAENNTTTNTPDLFKTGDAQATTNRLVITLGCHSGVPVSDQLLQSALSADWAQTYGAQGAIDFIGNTGFGLGETAGVAYSEQLQVLLAQRLDGSMTVGQALAFAKQEYAGSVPTTSGYQLKVLDEAELYGLPMYQVGTGTAASGSATPQPIDIDPGSGLPSAAFTSTQTYSPTTAATGTFYTPTSAPGSAAFEDRRPIEPLVKLDVTQPNLVAHGAVITSLTSSDAPIADAAFSRVVDDLSSQSPELGGDVIYPSKLQSITTFATPTGARQRLLLFGGQFRGANLTAGVTSAIGKGTQRLFNSFGGIVLYSGLNATDFEAPTFGPVAATSPTPSTVAFAVDVTDNLGPENVKRVVALYRDNTNTWRSIDLSRTGATTRWSGTGAFGGGTVEWHIQGVDGSGNVGVTSNKADLETPIAPSHTGSLTVTLNPSAPTSSGWFNGSVVATISGGSGITYSLDGAPFATGTQTTVSGTGVHTLEAQSDDGSSATAIVPIDVTPPVVFVADTTTTGVPPRVKCTDAGSGVLACTPGTFDTSLGTHTVHVHAVDNAGNTTDVDKTYTVDSFSGFFQPVDNPPTLNLVNAGNAIPIKFSLGLNAGLGIIQAGYPVVQQVACDSTAPLDTIEQTVTANVSNLTYDSASNQYSYVWKTNNAWSGTCRQFILRLTDGTEHRASFKFK